MVAREELDNDLTPECLIRTLATNYQAFSFRTAICERGNHTVTKHGVEVKPMILLFP